MNFKDFSKKWQDIISKANRYGIPVPTARDPRTGKGSITTALVVFSAGLLGLCILFMLATVVAKWTGLFTLTDLSIAQVKMAADYSFQFFLATLGGYLGRHLQKGEVVDSTLPPVTLTPKSDDPDQQV